MDLKKKMDELKGQLVPESRSRELHAKRVSMWGQDKNCLSYWWPKIKDTVPTPKTEIVLLQLTYDEDKELWGILDGGPIPEWFPGFVSRLQDAAVKVNGRHGPWFLRTGVFSGKHRWVDTCAVKHLDLMGTHALSLFEMSQMVDFIGLPYGVWALREWLPGPNIGNYAPYRYMPIRREFRVFAKAGEVLCWHPYWPADAFFDSEVPNTPEYAEMCRLEEGSDDHRRVMNLAKLASSQLPDDEWSVDVFWTSRGWYVTDMALAKNSWHDASCDRMS